MPLNSCKKINLFIDIQASEIIQPWPLGIRGTAATRLALAGCTVPQIAAITGHSMKDVESILEAHYLGGAVELAEAAIVKLNAVYG